MKVYLDYAATSPVKPAVLKAMLPYLKEDFGNPSSIHQFGQKARHAIDQAREQVAKFLGCKTTEIIFTSGGTESDNLAIRGIVTQLHSYTVGGLPHIITSAIEHHAILETCRDLEKKGLVEVTYLPVSREGLVSVSDVQKAIKPNTILVSIMYVNNEVGTIQPIREIGKMIEKINHTHNSSLKTHILFHTDAVQAVEYFNCNVHHLHVDLLSLSAHKFGGPKGVGVLYVRDGVNLSPQITGGHQEWRRRAGTENVAGVVGLGKAIAILTKRLTTNDQRLTTKLRDYFIDRIFKEIPDSRLNGSRDNRSPNNINVSFSGAEGESILLNLDLAGVAASSGSACTSGSLEPSHVLLAMSYKPEETHGSIRFTLGEGTTKKEIDYVLDVLPKIIKRLRDMAPE